MAKTNTRACPRRTSGSIRRNPRNYYPDYEDQFNKDFWESGGEVYHATTEENADDIEKDGIEARSQTRGMSNRNEGSAVYTTTDIDETEMEVLRQRGLCH